MSNPLIFEIQEVYELIVDHFKKINSDVFVDVENVGFFQLSERKTAINAKVMISNKRLPFCLFSCRNKCIFLKERTKLIVESKPTFLAIVNNIQYIRVVIVPVQKLLCTLG